MSLLLFEGAAGTGKTTQLLRAAREHLELRPLANDQRVLGLTKLHGSRRRMDGLLRGRDGVGNALDCATIDSFALQLLSRWRSLALSLDLSPAPRDFSAITTAAGVLLQDSTVARWVARRYPMIVVDEMQDCKAGEVNLLASLEPHVDLLAAADAFQDLSGSTTNEAIVWAASVGTVEVLRETHRTTSSGLLNASQALRNSSEVPSDRLSGFELISSPKHQLGAAVLSWKIRSWEQYGQIAVISATSPGTSPFVDSLLDLVSTKAATTKKSAATAGPFTLTWESGDDAATKEVLERLDLPSDSAVPVTLIDLEAISSRARLKDVIDWSRFQRFVLGKSTASVAEVIEAVSGHVRRKRVFSDSHRWRRKVMTIHQAKNREFESVVVLWPLKMTSSPDQRRRLLYNAVTRARGRAAVIVQDPKNCILDTPLFRGDA